MPEIKIRDHWTDVRKGEESTVENQIALIDNKYAELNHKVTKLGDKFTFEVNLGSQNYKQFTLG